MNALKKLLAWVRSDPQQEELDARRAHFEQEALKARQAVNTLELLGANWLPFSSCAYAWRIGGIDWPTSVDVVELPLHTMTTWPEDQREVAAVFSLGLMGYRWSNTYKVWHLRQEPASKSYVDAYYEVAELLQVEKADFKPLNLSVPEVVKAHILSLMAVETAYLNLLEKNTQRKVNLNKQFGKLGSPDIKISSQGVAVDQGYFWNYDMDKCPQGKVQLLGKGGIPAYGYKAQGGDFWQAWAPLPKTSK